MTILERDEDEKKVNKFVLIKGQGFKNTFIKFSILDIKTVFKTQKRLSNVQHVCILWL